ncbi:MAG: hypothetical protein AAB846_02870 [Patescibacteria group bacterium]
MENVGNQGEGGQEGVWPLSDAQYRNERQKLLSEELLEDDLELVGGLEQIPI